VDNIHTYIHTYVRSLMLTAFGSLACGYCWTLNAQDGPLVIAVARVGMPLKARMGWITGPQESLFRISPLFCGIFTSRSIPLPQTPRPSACQMLDGSLHGNPRNVSVALNTCLCSQSIDGDYILVQVAVRHCLQCSKFPLP